MSVAICGMKTENGMFININKKENNMEFKATSLVSGEPITLLVYEDTSGGYWYCAKGDIIVKLASNKEVFKNGMFLGDAEDLEMFYTEEYICTMEQLTLEVVTALDEA